MQFFRQVTSNTFARTGLVQFPTGQTVIDIGVDTFGSTQGDNHHLIEVKLAGDAAGDQARLRVPIYFKLVAGQVVFEMSDLSLFGTPEYTGIGALSVAAAALTSVTQLDPSTARLVVTTTQDLHGWVGIYQK